MNTASYVCWTDESIGKGREYTDVGAAAAVGVGEKGQIAQQSEAPTAAAASRADCPFE